MSVAEIRDKIESYARVKERNFKEKVILNNVLADQISSRVARLLDNKVEIKQIWDFFPNLFEEEKKQFEQEKEQDEFERYKLRKKQFANKVNKKFGGDN